MPLPARVANSVTSPARRPVHSTSPPITDCNASSLATRTYIRAVPAASPRSDVRNLRYLATNASSELFGSLHAGSSTAPMRSR